MYALGLWYYHYALCAQVLTSTSTHRAVHAHEPDVATKGQLASIAPLRSTPTVHLRAPTCDLAASLTSPV